MYSIKCVIKIVTDGVHILFHFNINYYCCYC